MGILARFGDIMRANINDLLTGAENKNAEKLLNQYLRDAREDYAQVRNETASVMAEETAAKRRLDELNDQMVRYSGKIYKRATRSRSRYTGPPRVSTKYRRTTTR